jgi:hypothetical protein
VHSPLENRASRLESKLPGSVIVLQGKRYVLTRSYLRGIISYPELQPNIPTQRRNLYGHYHTAIGGEPENMSSSSTKKEAASCVDMPKSLRPPSGFRGAGSRVGCAHGRFVGGSRVLVEFAKGLRFKPGRSETEGGF